MVEEKELIEEEEELNLDVGLDESESEPEPYIDDSELDIAFSDPDLRKGIQDALIGESEFAYIDMYVMFDRYRTLFNKLIRNFDISVDAITSYIENESFNLRGESIKPIIKFYEPERVLSDDLQQITSNFVDNSFIFLTDAVIRAVGITKTYYKKIVFKCSYCHTEIEIRQNFLDRINKPAICPNPNCNNKTKFTKGVYGSITGTYQETYVSTDTNNYLKCYILDDQIGKVKPGDKTHIIGKLTTIFKSTGENSFIPVIVANNVEVTGEAELSQMISNHKRIFMIPDQGIFSDILDKNGLNVECIVPFDEFVVKQRFKTKIGPVNEYHYNGYLRYRVSLFPFYDENINGINEILNRGLSLIKKSDRAMVSVLLQYLDRAPDKSKEISEIMGFTSKGWKLPHNSVILLKDAHTLEVRNRLLEIDFNIDEFAVAEIFRDFFKATSIEYKEIILAWVLAAPFFYVIKKRENIQPFLSINGQGQSGKSTFLDALITRGYGHITPQNSSSTKSESKVEGAIASSTFPFFFDDLHKANEKIVDLLKSYLTIDGRFQRKGAGKGKQFYSVDKPYVAPIAATSNASVNWLNDQFFLERVIHINVRNGKKDPNWKKYRDSLPIGYLLVLLYKETKDWTAESVYRILDKYKEQLNSNPDYDELDIRTKDIYTIMLFGRNLALRLFGIELDISELPKIINETREMYDNVLKSMVLQQIIDGQYTSYYDSVLNVSLYRFVSNSGWVKTPLYSSKMQIDNKLEKVICWRTPNIIELQKSIEGPNITKPWTYAEFQMKLENIFPRVYRGVRNMRYYDKEGNERKLRDRAVSIPEEDINLIYFNELSNNNSENEEKDNNILKEFGVE